MLPLQVTTAYDDLMQRFRSAPPVSIEGSILRIEKGGRGYWVARQRIGSIVLERSIGPDSEDVRKLVEQAKKEQAVRDAWNQGSARIVSMLRAAGCLTPDQTSAKILSALDRVGFFRQGGILGGTQAFRHYPLLLGANVPETVFSITGDMDIMAPSHMVLATEDGNLSSQLTQVGLDLRTVFGLTQQDAPKWVIDGSVELEILSPIRHGGEPSHIHKGVGERVQALRYLEYAFKDPVKAVSLSRSGVLVTIPSPERYALHKLLVAQLWRRGCQPKKRKDLHQAEWLIEVLAEARPFELWTAWQDIWGRGPKWRVLLEWSLQERPDISDKLAEIERAFGRVRAQPSVTHANDTTKP